MLDFVIEKVKELEDICLCYNVSVFFVFGYKVGYGSRVASIELDPEKYNNPALLSATKYTLRSSNGPKVISKEIFCQKDRDDKKFNDPIAKGHRIDRLLEAFKNELSFFLKPKYCLIIVTNGDNNLSFNKKTELDHHLSKIIEELENCDFWRESLRGIERK